MELRKSTLSFWHQQLWRPEISFQSIEAPSHCQRVHYPIHSVCKHCRLAYCPTYSAPSLQHRSLQISCETDSVVDMQFIFIPPGLKQCGDNSLDCCLHIVAPGGLLNVEVEKAEQDSPAPAEAAAEEPLASPQGEIFSRLTRDSTSQILPDFGDGV